MTSSHGDPDDQDSVNSWAVRAEIEERKKELLAFADAIRKKDDWFVKVGDTARGLVEKWAEEAKLDATHPDVRDTIRELRAEAARVRLNDYLIVPHSKSLPDRDVGYQRIDADVTNAMKILRNASHAMQVPDILEDLGVLLTEDLVPESLHAELVKELESLAALEPKDFHPGTSGKARPVQDLIHPSLYPFDAASTQVKPGTVLPRTTMKQSAGETEPRPKFTTTMYFSNEYEIDFSSALAWIPSTIRVSEDGLDARIDSYINGLGSRERYPILYRLIEKVFCLVLPQLERTARSCNDGACKWVTSSSVDRWRGRGAHRNGTTRAAWDAILAAQAKEKKAELAEKAREKERRVKERLEEKETKYAGFMKLDAETAASEWNGKELKVIIKAADYVLLPGEEYSGTWHLEGMPHERIVASAIYYYDADEGIIDDGLGLRRIRDATEDFPDAESDHQQDFSLHIDDEEDSDDSYEEDYPSDMERKTYAMNPNIDVGVVDTARSSGTGKILAFPNWIQHKVLGIRNAAASVEETSPNPPKAARRKILCFFLVDDEACDEGEKGYPGFSYQGLEGMHVLTTRDVPEQAMHTNKSTLRFLLSVGCERLTGKELPAELAELVLDDSGVDFGMTWEDAESRRREFMSHRSLDGYTEGNREVQEQEFSLCEH